MRTTLRKGAAALLACVLALGLAGCGAKEPPPGALTGKVSISGSTALLPLAKAAKELFEEKHEWVTINVSGGGSFSGLNQVSTGAVDIGMSDIEAPPEMAEGLVEHRVSISPFVIVIHPDLPVENLTLEQAAQIFRGEITNWREVGGPDMPITVVSRPQSSGSRATIVATVLKGQGDITRNAVIQDSNGKVRETISTTPGAIGYVEYSYYQEEMARAVSIDGVPCTPENVLSGRYPIWSYGRMYTRGEPTGAAKAFLDFLLSSEFQEGYMDVLKLIPVTGMQAE
ncbi:MAG TPA: phosphate ABC transporter substrate-binding protein [Symbiobacteriaceae bacterium]